MFPPKFGSAIAVMAPEQVTVPSKLDESLAGRLSEVGRAVGSDMDPKDLLRLILEAATHITHATSGSVMLLNGSDNALRVEVATGFQDDEIYRTCLEVGRGITGWVAAKGRPLRVGDTAADERYYEIQPDIKSELAVPLNIDGRTIGVISVDSVKLRAFSSRDEAILVSLAAQSAKVIQNQQLYEEIRQKARALEMLSSVTAAVAGTLELDQVLEQVVNQAAKLMGAKLVSLMLIDDTQRALQIRAVSGGAEDYRTKPPLPIAGSVTGRVIQTREPVAIRDVRQEAGFRLLDLAEREGLRGLLSVPLLWHGRAIGALNIYTSQPYEFTPEEILLASSLATHSAIAIENARLHFRTRKSEEALRSADRLAVLGELAAGVAHEIRNPLATMNVILNLNQQTPQDLNMLKRQVGRLEQIVDRFLGYARERAVPEKRLVRLADVVSETCLLLQHQAAGRGVQLWADVQPDVPDWLGDPIELGQILYNLALNAVQAFDEKQDGEVVIRVRHESGGDGRVSPAIRIDVEDNGPGLPDLVRQKLFQPFVTTKEKGVGLGLSIVQRLVTRHAGTIEALDRPGGGMVFRVELPLREK